MDDVRRASRTLVALMGLGVAMSLLAWAAGFPPSVLATLRSRPDFDALLVAVTSLAAWACLIWFTGVIVLEIGAAIPGRAGRACSRAVRRCAPAVMRHLARWVVGTAMVATPLLAAPAMAASGGPSLDRPVAAAAAAPSPGAPSTTARSEPSDESDPARSDLYRPLAPYLPPPPPPAAKTSDDRGVPLLTGSPHRDLADDTYVVRRGDALWDIAARHLGPAASAAQIAREWPRWYEANRAVIGDNPNVIRPGEVLRAPAN